jgi:signal peptidase I
MKILRKVLSLFATFLVILFIFLAYGSINNRFYRVITVEGNSMSPTLWFGDLILVTPPPENIPVNTIVLMTVNGAFVTHRIIGYEENGRPITKGDANQSNDNFSGKSLRIMGVFQMRLPGLGYPLIYFNSLVSNLTTPPVSMQK